MDTDSINEKLNQRFAAPLPEFYQRRIIFWYDPDREFADLLGNIELENAKLVCLTGRNMFQVKELLNVDDTTSNYLIYDPLQYEKPEEDWLLDIKIYSEEFRADLISIWMNELCLPSTSEMRDAVKSYRLFFKAKNRREKIKTLDKVPSRSAQLHLAVMAVLAGLKEADPSGIIRAVLNGGLDEESNRIYQDFVRYGASNVFWTMVRQGTGYTADLSGGMHNLQKLAEHLLLTAASRTMPTEYLASLAELISEPHQDFCFDLVSDWIQNDEGSYYEVAESVEAALGLYQRFMKLEVKDLLDTKIFPCMDEIILTKEMTEIRDNIVDVEGIRNIVEKRRTCPWFKDVSDFYEGILQVSNMQDFYKKHSAGFHSAEPQKVWKEYTDDYYIMDTYYRKFHVHYAAGLGSYHEDLQDLFNDVCGQVENLYRNWFLGELGSNWEKVCSDELEKYGRILDIPQQTDFYKNKVARADTRIFVIISDALRYEVAAELARQIQQETQSKVELESMEGIFPTITKFGMAALLPHTELGVEMHGEELKVLADGQPTDSNYRDKILKKANPDSLALKYEDIVKAKRADRKAKVKGMKVVYIYHDTIDKASHTSDSMVFTACEETIKELKNLVNIIVNDFGATNILITADHGFLFTSDPLREEDKVDKGVKENIAEYGRRYVITKEPDDPEYLGKVKFLDGKSGYYAYAPKENIRIKMNGSGLNFVHGGTSLQEMCVPVIEYHFFRNSSKEYLRNKNKYDTKPVEISLLSAVRKISNKIFKMNFYQKEPVGGNRKAAVYQAYFTDNTGRQVSDIVRIIADKTSDIGQERIFHCTFNLKPLKFDSRETYYLVIADENGLVLSRDEFQIDIAFATDEFNFFD